MLRVPTNQNAPVKSKRIDGRRSTKNQKNYDHILLVIGTLSLVSELLLTIFLSQI